MPMLKMFGGSSTIAQTPKPAAAPVQLIGGGGARPPSFKKPAYKPPAKKPSGGGLVAPKVPSAIPRPSAPSGGMLAPKSPVVYPPKLSQTHEGEWGPWKTPPQISDGYGDVNGGNFPESGPSSSTVAESDAGPHGKKEALFNWWDIWGDVDPSTIHAPGGPTYGDAPAPGSAAYNAANDGAAVVPTSASGSGGSFFGGGSSGYGAADYGPDDYAPEPIARAATPPAPAPTSGPSSTTLAIGAGVVALGVVAYLKGWI